MIRAVAAMLALGLATSAYAANCKSYSNCEEAVRAWCAGQHNGADRDGDGIPCENVCKSLVQVIAIKQQIGCTR